MRAGLRLLLGLTPHASSVGDDEAVARTVGNVERKPDKQQRWSKDEGKRRHSLHLLRRSHLQPAPLSTTSSIHPPQPASSTSPSRPLSTGRGTRPRPSTEANDTLCASENTTVPSPTQQHPTPIAGRSPPSLRSTRSIGARPTSASVSPYPTSPQNDPAPDASLLETLSLEQQHPPHNLSEHALHLHDPTGTRFESPYNPFYSTGLSSSSLESAAISAFNLPSPFAAQPPPLAALPPPFTLAVPSLVFRDQASPDTQGPTGPVINICAASPSPDVSGPPRQPMAFRKTWVKRPGASATMVVIKDGDLVDDVRDKILAKYSNSLGKTFDSPDVTLRIVARMDGPRSVPQERLLGPEEDMCKTLDMYYPGGQSVAEALLIDIPLKRSPRPSPRAHQHHHGSQGHIPYHALEDYRPHESGTDYFPPMPVQPPNGMVHLPPQVLHLPEHSRSISVLQTGQVPPLPSPGAASRRHRPKYGRQHTSSPTLLAHPDPSVVAALNSPGLGAHVLPHRPSGRPRHDSNATERPHMIPIPPPLPTPPAAEAPAKVSTPPTPAAREHRGARPRKPRKATPTNGGVPANKNVAASMLDGSVPPINVLIVEDNIINLRVVEGFMKRLKVRWSTAMNGQIAVDKWKQGGFHLVLMDIQLPIMSGLDATKEIRRLERVNGIGVFSSSSPSTPLAKEKNSESIDREGQEARKTDADRAADKLTKREGLFKSPVIIVALTASSLQSDRHEALAAGCNDFLTKPVNFMWMERKVKEWGCMQALVDFDGWRQWKDFSSTTTTAASAAGSSKVDAAASAKSPVLDAAGKADALAAKKKAVKRDKRASADVGGLVTVGGE